MFAEVNGIRMHYGERGSGEPVLMLGGFGTDCRFWEHAAGMLDGFRVVMPDNRGAGLTGYSGGFGVRDMADDAVALMDHLGIRSAHVLGWSMGSHIAMDLAGRHPDRVTSLTLVSTHTVMPSRSAYVLRTLTGMAARGEAPTECLMVALNAFCFPESRFRELESTGRTMRLPRGPWDARGLADQLDAVDGFDAADAAGRVRVPTLVVHGTEDIMVDPSEGRRAAEAIRGSELLMVDGAGHNIPFGMYRDAFVDFARRNGSSGGSV